MPPGMLVTVPPFAGATVTVNVALAAVTGATDRRAAWLRLLPSRLATCTRKRSPSSADALVGAVV